MRFFMRPGLHREEIGNRLKPDLRRVFVNMDHSGMMLKS
jgi:hypothetical protein